MTKTDTFNFSEVPSWYALCLNHECPMREDCLRYLAGTHAPDSLETAVCVMPQTLKEGKCNLFDEKKVVAWAAGFSHLYDRVLKDDFTPMRKTITDYLSPEQQLWLKDYVADKGYEVEFDRYFEGYIYRQ